MYKGPEMSAHFLSRLQGFICFDTGQELKSSEKVVMGAKSVQPQSEPKIQLLPSTIQEEAQ